MARSEEIAVRVEERPNSAVAGQLLKALLSFNRAHAGDDNHRKLLITLRRSGDQVVGGLTGGTYYGYLHIDVLWVDDRYRRRGYGEQLLKAAEREAVRRGCRYVHLDTHGFQALSFYLKRGYVVAGTLGDLPPGDARYLLRKTLI